MKRILFCLLLVNSVIAQAQSLKWYEGSVVLATGKVLVGKIKVEPLLDVIFIEESNTNAVYPAHKVKSLYYYDEALNINRRFISIRDENEHYTNYQLFEIVVMGEVSVLRKQKTKGLRPSDALDFSYYVRYKDNVVLLRKFGKEIYPELKTSVDSRLDDFISENRLQADTSSNSIRIIEFYNQLLRSDEITAKY